mgnify:CR=1 FL=1
MWYRAVALRSVELFPCGRCKMREGWAGGWRLENWVDGWQAFFGVVGGGGDGRWRGFNAREKEDEDGQI